MFNFVLTLPGHRRHHPDDRPGGRRERADLRAVARGNGARQIAQDRPARPPTTRRSRSILDANVTTLITAAILFLESERPGQGFRDLAHARHPGLALHRAHCWSQRLRAGLSTAGRLKRISMLHLISTEAHQLPRQRLHRRDVLARVDSSRAGLRSHPRAIATSGSTFGAAICVSLSAAQKVQVAQVREALKPIRLDDASIQQSLAGRQELHHHSQPAQHERQGRKPDPKEHMPNGGIQGASGRNASARWSVANWRETRSGRSASAFLAS